MIIIIIVLAIITINDGNNEGSNVFIIASNKSSDPIRARPCNPQTHELVVALVVSKFTLVKPQY
jgi:hypothetical protein